MIQIQELYENLLAGIDATNDLIEKLDSENTVQDKDEFFSYMCRSMEYMRDHALMNQQTLVYIISEYFDGEFIMSSGEVNYEFKNRNFHLEVFVNDDGSVKLVSGIERQE